MTTGATAVTRPPAAGLRVRAPVAGQRTREKGRRLETTTRLETAARSGEVMALLLSAQQYLSSITSILSRYLRRGLLSVAT